jgi:hypothetical protein
MTNERRKSLREGTVDRGVQCHTECTDGTALEGIVVDVSLGGTKIQGSVVGLTVGDSVRLVFQFLTGEKVAYDGVVRHISAPLASFGVEFTSEPQPIEVHDT